MAGGPLRGPTFLLVQWRLEAFGQDVVSQPANYVLGTQQFSVDLWPVCSGYTGIGLMGVFVGAYLWLLRRTLRFSQSFYETCYSCNGTGKILAMPIIDIGPRYCSHCGRQLKKKKVDDTCSSCGGTGKKKGYHFCKKCR